MDNEDCIERLCKIKNEHDTGEILAACSHDAILTYLKSEKARKGFLEAMERYGYELRVVKKEQCY